MVEQVSASRSLARMMAMVLYLGRFTLKKLRSTKKHKTTEYRQGDGNETTIRDTGLQ